MIITGDNGIQINYCDKCRENGKDTVIGILPGMNPHVFYASKYCPY